MSCRIPELDKTPLRVSCPSGRHPEATHGDLLPSAAGRPGQHGEVGGVGVAIRAPGPRFSGLQRHFFGTTISVASKKFGPLATPLRQYVADVQGGKTGW